MNRNNVRGWAEYLGATRVRFHCPAGHTWTEDLGRKSLPVAKRIGETGTRMMASWWSREKGGVNLWCKACAAAGKLTR